MNTVDGLLGVIGLLLGVIGTWGARLIRPRSEVQSTDAQVAISGFTALMAASQSEMLRLNTRIGQLESALRAAGIPVP